MWKWIYEVVLMVLHRQCKHPDNEVVADIADGDLGTGVSMPNRQISWCRICGAIRRSTVGPGSMNQDPMSVWEVAYSPWRRSSFPWTRSYRGGPPRPRPQPLPRPRQ